MKAKWGKKEYFEELFFNSSIDDPWRHNWRISQQDRYCQYLKLLNRFKKKNLRILDIGCALGDFTVQLKELLQLREIYAIDISEEAIRRADLKYRNSGIKFRVGALPNLEEFKNDSFNIVLVLEVLYYLEKEDRIKALKEIKRILKEDGFLLISVNINKPPYFKIDEFYNLIDDFFLIKKVEYRYAKIYSFFERKLLILDRSVFKKLVRYLLSLKVLVSVCQSLTNFTMAERGITGMIILAQNKR